MQNEQIRRCFCCRTTSAHTHMQQPIGRNWMTWATRQKFASFFFTILVSLLPLHTTWMQIHKWNERKNANWFLRFLLSPSNALRSRIAVSRSRNLLRFVTLRSSPVFSRAINKTENEKQLKFWHTSWGRNSRAPLPSRRRRSAQQLTIVAAGKKSRVPRRQQRDTMRINWWRLTWHTHARARNSH